MNAQLLSYVWLCDICSTAGFPVQHHFWSLLRLTSIESVMPFNHLILCQPLLLLPSIISSIRIFSNESALPITWPKDWSCSISPSNEYSVLISFRIDWFDFFAVQDWESVIIKDESSLGLRYYADKSHPQLKQIAKSNKRMI